MFGCNLEFLIKVVLSFFVGGLTIGAVILIAENMGARIGAVIAGMPTTTLVSTIFIQVTSGSEVLKESVLITPLISSFALIFGLVFVFLVNRLGSFAAIIVALFCWFLPSFLIKSYLSEVNFLVVLSSASIFLFCLDLFMKRFKEIPPSKKGMSKSMARKSFLTKAIVSGFIVALAVTLAKLVNPLWGGMFSAFPASVSATVFFLAKAQGSDFVKGLLRGYSKAFISILTFQTCLYYLATNINPFLVFGIAVSACLIYPIGMLYINSRKAKVVK